MEQEVIEIKYTDRMIESELRELEVKIEHVHKMHITLHEKFRALKEMVVTNGKELNELRSNDSKT
jgi:hypothetical protein